MISPEFREEVDGELRHPDISTSPSSPSKDGLSAENMIIVDRTDGREKVSANDLDNHREGKWVNR